MQAVFVRLSDVENRILENRVTYCIIGDWGIKRIWLPRWIVQWSGYAYFIASIALVEIR